MPTCAIYARRMGQPTQRATHYTARSNIDTAQIFLHANGQRPTAKARHDQAALAASAEARGATHRVRPRKSWWPTQAWRTIFDLGLTRGVRGQCRACNHTQTLSDDDWLWQSVCCFQLWRGLLRGLEWAFGLTRRGGGVNPSLWLNIPSLCYVSLPCVF